MKKILIANRGEIACRIIESCKKLNLHTIAVYSDADKKSKHVRISDEAVHIGESKAQESYLSTRKIINAALSSKADAIHPGYGFLSENAEFAQKVMDSGITWIGPKPNNFVGSLLIILFEIAALMIGVVYAGLRVKKESFL